MSRRRMMVAGVTGSGKTVLSRRIAAALGVPAIELDALFWRPGWRPTPVDEFRAKVCDALDAAPDGWVTDGNYSMARDLIVPRADTFVWLRLPWRVSYWRLLKRTVTRAWRNDELWNGNRESFRQALLKRDSILLWGLTHWRAHHRGVRQDLETIPHGAEVVELRHGGEIEAFVGCLD